MRLVKAQFRGGSGDIIYTHEQQTVICAAFVALEEEFFEFTEEGKVKRWYSYHLWDLDAFPLEHMSELSDIKPLKLNARVSEVFTARSTTVYNEHVKVVMPGLGMLQFDQVKVEYDCCTDSLQARLNDGWRIIATCPQPDQRRPDYVLGRVTPSTEKF